MMPIDPVTTLADAHSEWHAVHGYDVECPLDCGEAERRHEATQARPRVRCGHCGDRHTVAGVAVCAATYWMDRA